VIGRRRGAPPASSQPPAPRATGGGDSPAPPPGDFPLLTGQHLDDARLFADRADMVRALAPSGGVVAEVGVGLGDFSALLLEFTEPSSFVAIDTFQLHELPELWGRPTSEQFEGLTHAEFYRRRFAERAEQVVIEQGASWDALARYPDGHFDFVYVDAGHDYESVTADAAAAAAKTREGGLLIFNDYVMFDHMTASPYGVVQGVNELVVSTGWPVVGFALQHHMFCDIAVRRGPS
jgi:hypothetical protein